jgi:hypothetical protein
MLRPCSRERGEEELSNEPLLMKSGEGDSESEGFLQFTPQHPNKGKCTGMREFLARLYAVYRHASVFLTPVQNYQNWMCEQWPSPFELICHTFRPFSRLAQFSQRTIFAACNFRSVQFLQHTISAACNFRSAQFSQCTIFGAHNLHRKNGRKVTNKLEKAKATVCTSNFGNFVQA